MNDTIADTPWLDRPDALELIDARLAAGSLDETQAQRLRDFSQNGFVQIETLDDHELIDGVASEMMSLVESNLGRPVEQWVEQLQNMCTSHPATKRAVCHPKVLAWCDLVLGTRALPFQSMSVPQGTQILPHVDSILMSTRPQNYLVVAWWALEDVAADCDPLTIWPGSHRLDYVGPEDFGVARGTERPEAARIHNERYYAHIREVLDASGIEPVEYLPTKGSVLLWHSNVIHGGAPTLRADSSRRSLVVHYFGEGAEHYSDLFSEPCALLGLR